MEESTVVRASTLIDQLSHFVHFHHSIIESLSAMNQKHMVNESTVKKDDSPIQKPKTDISIYHIIACYMVEFLLERGFIKLTDEIHRTLSDTLKIQKGGYAKVKKLYVEILFD
jgi:hypothetical protein